MRWTRKLVIAIHCVMCGFAATGCGLDGVRGELVRIDGYHYLLKAPDGHELRLRVDSRTHKDVVQPGDDVQAYITEDGYAEFIQRLEK
ncbi:MAG: hypothetical protein H0V35_10415 [Nitrospira sp.]|nr:hypothetical protein [Nitrospira sp.]